jgi:hypothetical protein
MIMISALRTRSLLRAPFLAMALLASALSACSSPSRQPAVPAALTDQATVLGGLPHARYFVDTQVAQMVDEAYAALDRERAQQGQVGAAGPLPPANYLAVSGGGDDGAFGAGLLVGWTERGDRPTFKLVTGVSTGALIAPFAFLGPRYDPMLRKFYTEVKPDDIFESRSLLTLFSADALSDTTPLFGLISKLVDDKMMAEIAGEYAKGRLLLIGTTDLDAQRPVIWNIGAIAASGRPGALDLIHRILLASAAVPAAFPPVMIDVEAGGQKYQELHVDGGAIAQTFLYPPTLMTEAARTHGQFTRERHAYVIRNGRLDANWASVDRRVFSVAGRAISTMIHYSGVNDVFRLQAITKRDGVDFNLAYIGKDFSAEHKEDFDQTYMRALFDYGRAQVLAGTVWHKSSPYLTASPQMASPGS